MQPVAASWRTDRYEGAQAVLTRVVDSYTKVSSVFGFDVARDEIAVEVVLQGVGLRALFGAKAQPRDG
jgi:hypothetical protein